MAMKQIGWVVQKEGRTVKIRVERDSACGGNCAGCHGCPQNAIVFSYPDHPDAPFQVGEQVCVVMPTRKFFGGIFQSYGILILGMLLGAIVGYCWTGKDGGAVLGGFIGLGLGGFLVYRIAKNRSTGITVFRMENVEEDGRNDNNA